MRRTGPAFQPFASRGRKAVAAILATFALFSAVSVTLSVWATSRSQYKASVLEVAARQRTLAERYVREVLLVRAGAQADPAYVGALLDRSARALLEGGTAPAVNGDDDETFLSAAKGKRIRAQLVQERKLVRDLRATGAAFLAGRPVAHVHLSAHERLHERDPVSRLRILSALTSNVSLNAARSIAAADDRNVDNLITLQTILGAAGFLVSLLLGWALIGATRRQTAHFRSLVISSTDLVLVFDHLTHTLSAIASLSNSSIRARARSRLASCTRHGTAREISAGCLRRNMAASHVTSTRWHPSARSRMASRCSLRMVRAFSSNAANVSAVRSRRECHLTPWPISPPVSQSVMYSR